MAEPAEEGQQGTEWVEVDSTAVASVGYDEEAGQIYVVWHSGSESVFEGDRSTFEGLTGAASVGRAVNELMGRTGTGAEAAGTP
jgi:hypothetical protein